MTLLAEKSLDSISPFLVLIFDKKLENQKSEKGRQHSYRNVSTNLSRSKDIISEINQYHVVNIKFKN